MRVDIPAASGSITMIQDPEPSTAPPGLPPPPSTPELVPTTPAPEPEILPGPEVAPEPEPLPFDPSAVWG